MLTLSNVWRNIVLGSSRLFDAWAYALTVGDNGPKVGSFINLNFDLADDCVLYTAGQCSLDFATP
jgi:hypothetical protein